MCADNVPRTLNRKSLAALRKQVEPVEQQAFARFLTQWHGLDRKRRGLDGLLDVIEQLQGAALPASDWLRRVLPARVDDFQAAMLDELCVAGELLWQGCESIGPSDGRVALYLTDHAARLMPEQATIDDELEQQIQELLSDRGALLFDEITQALGAFPNDVLDALWRLVWKGHATNDTFAPLRSLLANGDKSSSKRRGSSQFRSRRRTRLPGSEGRWSLLGRRSGETVSVTERQTAIAMQLLERYGVVTRELVASEGVPGRFSGMYPIYKAMEEAGRVRRGYFIAGQGAAQFAAPGAEDRLRDQQQNEKDPTTIVLASTDPANPYGAALKWPETIDEASRPQRSAGGRVVLLEGQLLAHLNKNATRLLTFLPPNEPEHSVCRAALVKALSANATSTEPLYLQVIDGQPAHESLLGAELVNAGFVRLRDGFVHRGPKDDGPGKRE